MRAEDRIKEMLNEEHGEKRKNQSIRKLTLKKKLVAAGGASFIQMIEELSAESVVSVNGRCRKIP